MLVTVQSVDTQDNLTPSPFVEWVWDKLPSGFIRELHIAAPGPVTLNTINNGTCYFYCNGKPYATTSVTPHSEGPVIIYSISTRRPIGACVFGDITALNYDGATIYTLNPAPSVAPAFILPFNYNTVTSISDVHGNTTTGEVNLVSGLGAVIRNVNNRTVGVDFPYPQDRSPLKKLRFVWSSGSCFVATTTGGILNVTYQGMDLDDLCGTKTGNLLPDSEGNLPPVIPPKLPEVSVPGTGGAPSGGSFDVNVSSLYRGSLTINAVSPTGASRLRVSKSGDNSIKFELLG